MLAKKRHVDPVADLADADEDGYRLTGLGAGRWKLAVYSTELGDLTAIVHGKRSGAGTMSRP